MGDTMTQDPTTFHLMTRDGSYSVFCNDRCPADSKSMKHRRTNQIKKSNCLDCLMLWDMWVTICASKPPMPSKYNMQQIRGKVRAVQEEEKKRAKANRKGLVVRPFDS